VVWYYNLKKDIDWLFSGFCIGIQLRFMNHQELKQKIETLNKSGKYTLSEESNAIIKRLNKIKHRIENQQLKKEYNHSTRAIINFVNDSGL